MRFRSERAPAESVEANAPYDAYFHQSGSPEDLDYAPILGPRPPEATIDISSPVRL